MDPHIGELILSIRGQRVMLDIDLAALYGVETRTLNQAVKRNIERFPEDFIFSLSRSEIGRISQAVISSHGHARLKYAKSVTAFTEQGVAMLSSVLRSKRAIRVNVAIMRTFVNLRKMISQNKELARRLDDLEKNYDAKFRVVFDAIRRLMVGPEGPRKKIGFRP